MTKQKKHAILILGMHRSGTSASARIANLLGAELPDDLLAANAANAKGYWEPRAVVEFNDRLLAGLNHGWDDPVACAELESRIEPASRKDAAKVLKKAYGTAGLIVVKDPRCTLIPGYWIAALEQAGYAVSVLFCVRGAADVAASLDRRDGIDPDTAALLWAQYNLNVLRVAASRALVRLDYDRIREDWPAAFAQLAESMAIEWPNSPSSQAGAIKAFLDSPRPAAPALRGGVAAGIAAEVGTLLQRWPELAGAEALSALEGRIAQTSALLISSQQRHRRMQADLRHGLEQAERDAEAARKVISSLEGEREAARQAQDDAERRTLAAQRVIEGLESDLTAARDAQADAESRTLAAQQVIEGLESDLTAARDAQADAESRTLTAQNVIEGLESDLTAARDAQADAESRTLAAQRVIEGLESDLTAARDAQADAENRTLAAQQVIEGLESDLTAARNAQADAESRTLAAQRVIEGLEGDLGVARDAQADAESRAKSGQTVIRSLQDELDAARDAQADADQRARQAQTTINALESDLSDARAVIDEADAAAQRAQSVIQTIEGERDSARAAFEQAVTEIERAQGELERARLDAEARLEDFRELERSAIAYREHSERLELELRQAQSDYVLADVERLALRLDKASLEHRLTAIEQSRFWRATGPLRRLLSSMPGVTRLVKQSLRLAWKIATLQVFRGGNSGHAAGAIATTAAMPESGAGLPPLETLKPFLTAEFDSQTATTITQIISRYALPFQREGMPAIKTVTGDAAALAWARRLADRAGPAAAEPDVSIVMPVYNQIAFTLACIDSLQGSKSRYSYEILVGDDLSTDGTQAAASVEIPGVKWIRHPENLGFVRNCNTTASHAAGRYVVFLNNDTIVLPGWLDELIDTLRRDPAAGLAGSKLVYPDGRLQEAGGIFWQDGSAWNYGRFDDPRRPEYSYARQVDYISGASIALPLETWKQIGGFDDDYAPAYAEDADLAFRLRAAGYTTVYQPRSQLLHFEGVSSGTDTGAGIKAYQVINLERLRGTWGETLAAHRPNAELPEFEKERHVTRRALFVDITTPEPQHDAGSVVAVECMRAMRDAGYKVSFVPQDNFLWTAAYSAPLQREGIEAIYHPYYSRFRPFLEQRGGEYEFIFLHRYHTAERTIADIRELAPGAKVVLLNADLHYLREMREAELLGDAGKLAMAEATRARELSVMRTVDLVLTHSTVELEILQQELGEQKVGLLSLVHDPEPTPMAFAERHGIGFLGGFGHPPNTDAVDWFLQDIWPRVRAELPDARFVLAGSKMPTRFKRLDGKNGVQVLGFVETLEEYFGGLRLNVVPLRFGAGAKGKVAASLAFGVPTVSSDVGVEGMGLKLGDDVIVADNAEAFAAEIIRFYRDEAAWETVRANGLSHAGRVTSRAALRVRLNEIMAQLGLIDT